MKTIVGIPHRLTADAGYHSAANLETLRDVRINALIPPDKLKHTQLLPAAPRGRIPEHLSAKDRMRRKLQTKPGRAIYRMHKAIVEPVVGQIKAARGFQRFLLRGLAKVRGEWMLVATVHNICKLFQAEPKVRRALAVG
jgi:IS5 family transposase